MSTHSRSHQLEEELIRKEASDFERSKAFQKLAEELENEIYELLVPAFKRGYSWARRVFEDNRMSLEQISLNWEGCSKDEFGRGVMHFVEETKKS